jgi:hypothetical protein
MKEVTAAPIIKIRSAMKTKKFEKMDERPTVRLPSTLNEIPRAILSARRRRKTVDPALRPTPRIVNRV